jgi:hypothetical protein
MNDLKRLIYDTILKHTTVVSTILGELAERQGNGLLIRHPAMGGLVRLQYSPPEQSGQAYDVGIHYAHFAIAGIYQ